MTLGPPALPIRSIALPSYSKKFSPDEVTVAGYSWPHWNSFQWWFNRTSTLLHWPHLQTRGNDSLTHRLESLLAVLCLSLQSFQPHSPVIKDCFGWPLNISWWRESRQAFASAISNPSAKARYNQIASMHLMLNSSYHPLIPSKRETIPIPLLFLHLPGRRQIYFFRIKILLLEQLDIPVLLQQISINHNLVIRLWDRLIHWKIWFVPIQAFL